MEREKLLEQEGRVNLLKRNYYRMRKDGRGWERMMKRKWEGDIVRKGESYQDSRRINEG